jgi:hypothetical protein
MARLDLASVLDVAQLAACIGREFGYELLAAALSGAICAMRSTGLWSPGAVRRGHGSRRSTGSSALVQDALWLDPSIAPSELRDDGGRLETDFPRSPEPELLGLHYARRHA